MTKEEAINHIRYGIIEENYPLPKELGIEACKMAIKALEKEPILDKIRTEIDGLTYYWCEVNPRSVIDDVLKIIDKYKKEGEE